MVPAFFISNIIYYLQIRKHYLHTNKYHTKMKILNYALLISFLALVSCDVDDSLNPSDEEATSKQRIRLTNYLHDFSDQAEKVGFTRDESVTVNGVHFSANQMNMYYEYNTKDSLLKVNSNIQLLDENGNLLSEQTYEMVNNKEYTFFACGVLGETEWFKPAISIVESDIHLASDGLSHVRFAHFNPSYDSIKVVVGEQIIPMKFGEISEYLAYDYNKRFEYMVDGKVDGSFVSVHGIASINYNAQNNHVMIITKMGQGYDENGIFHHTEIMN